MKDLIINDIPCSVVNYGGGRWNDIQYIVVHYTAGINDTAQNNGIYFSRERIGASAHYFVDETTIVRSVPDDRIAFHCGGQFYYHPDCRNSNSIGVEICSKYSNGQYSFAPEAVERAQLLVRALMEKYDIPVENVVRHWDVTHKVCPAPFVGAAGENAWQEFKEGLVDEVRYHKIEEIPDWGQSAVQALIDRELLNGDPDGDLDLSRDMVRLMTILDRAGLFNELT